MDIKGKTALITGGGAGIGRATALALAAKGAGHIVVADIDGAAAAETAALAQAAGSRALARAVDVTDLAALTALFAEAEAAAPLDIVFNNAGVVSGSPAFPDIPLARLLRTVQINLLAMMAGTQLAIDLFRARGARGVIVNTSSVAAFAPMTQDPAYSASKVGILNFTQACAPLGESHGIRVNAVCPGVTDTAIVKATGDGVTPAAWLAPALARVKLLTPDDIARAVIDLIEDETKAGAHTVVQNEAAA